jgi:methionyl-tRNA formyltransferase
MSKPLRIAFFGSPEPARVVLSRLIESDHEVVAVITQPDKRRGRGSSMVPTVVKQLAVESYIDVFTPANKSELDDVVSSITADVGVVVAYGKIVSTHVLNHFPYGCLNIHYSLLPRWRGAAPVERSILAGDSVTGVSIMKMTEGLDEGPVYLQRQVDILSHTTTANLFESMNAISADMLDVVLASLDSDKPTEQNGDASYAHKLSKEDFSITHSTSVVDVDRRVRAGALIKGAHFLSGGESFRILHTGEPVMCDVVEDTIGTLSESGVLTCHDGQIQCVTIQVPSKPAMDFQAWANGVDKSKFPLRIDA